MLIFNPLRARNSANDERALFEVSYPIKVPRTPQSGLGQTLILTGYSSKVT